MKPQNAAEEHADRDRTTRITKAGSLALEGDRRRRRAERAHHHLALAADVEHARPERDRDREADEDQRRRRDERLGDRPDGGRDVSGRRRSGSPSTIRPGSPNAPGRASPRSR